MKALKTALLAVAMPFLFQSGTNAQDWTQKSAPIPTRWAKLVHPKRPLSEYPRPQMQRKIWQNLNGLWEYCISAEDASKPKSFSGKILVPYPIESALSGVQRPLKPDQALWYKRSFVNPELNQEEKALLNFGAVDYEATVFLNGEEVGKHTGGYQSFYLDITGSLKPGINELMVKVWDPTDQGANPHGKQVLNPHGIMYTASSGIWQTVWMETVPVEYISGLQIIPDVDRSEVSIIVKSDANSEVILSAAGKTVKGKTNTPIIIPIKNARLWSPDDPYLYDLTVNLGKDKVKSYFGMRKIEVKKDERGIDRIFLNNKYTYNLGTLDQGFWPDGLYTAPTDEALAFDIKASKAMGFNTIRKHIKVEPARWYYHADKLGMLVWQDMVNPGNDTPEGRAQFEKENKEVIAQLYNHPSIVTWVLFNEKWGQYDQERLTKELKQLDPTRLINGHSGEMLYVNDALRSPSPNAWVGADMTDVHAYPNPGHIKFEKGKAAVLGEFGGIGVPVEGHLWDDLAVGWGYDGIVSAKEMREHYKRMVDSLKILELEGLAASIYTQPFDVESEQNGIMTYDRSVTKIPFNVIRNIHSKIRKPTSNSTSLIKTISVEVAADSSASLGDRITEYQQGRREPDFLRNLALVALNNKQFEWARRAADDYIISMDDPYKEPNLRFIKKLTLHVDDEGFRVLNSDREKVNRILGQDEAEIRVTYLINESRIKPKISKDLIADWKKIEEDLFEEYGELGKEITWQEKMFNCLYRKDWKEFATIGKKWFEYYGQYRKWIKQNLVNQICWGVFQETNERSALETAVSMTSLSLQKQLNPNMLDTHANLLYKLGKIQEAIKWEKEALAIEPDNQEFKETLEKMQLGVKTWEEK